MIFYTVYFTALGASCGGGSTVSPAASAAPATAAAEPRAEAAAVRATLTADTATAASGAAGNVRYSVSLLAPLVRKRSRRMCCR